MKMRSIMLRSLLLVLLPLAQPAHAEGEQGKLPLPARDEPLSAAPGQQRAVFAGGCFWGVQAVFQHVKGVVSATSGYAGGSANLARYELVSRGDTGHAESVEVVYDPSKVSYGKLLQIYFSVAHNPMELNRQGPDEGTQYRSEIFAVDAAQQQIAEAYIRQLSAARLYPHPIVTRVASLPAFYAAEGYHQDFARKHPTHPYIARFDLPKLTHLQQQYPELYRAD
ncbi:MAG TPA: peptide-methionine (S)-S-oxide reductase MsrA [Gallionellaceae bacterium]|nr:peptide-methionine (S)-S-oxide reductase MsrA [Gallionellaceae bacterium]